MLTKITLVETRLFFREPGVWLLAILLPTIVLVVVGLLFGVEPDPALGGRRWIDIFAPSMVVMTLAILGVNTLPARLVKYREKGVMRRLSHDPGEPADPPDRPARGQHGGGRSPASSLLLAVGNLVLQVPLPKDLVGFAARLPARACRPCSRWASWSPRWHPTPGTASCPVRPALRARDVPRRGVPPAA